MRRATRGKRETGGPERREEQVDKEEGIEHQISYLNRVIPCGTSTLSR